MKRFCSVRALRVLVVADAQEHVAEPLPQAAAERRRWILRGVELTQRRLVHGDRLLVRERHAGRVRSATEAGRGAVVDAHARPVEPSAGRVHLRVRATHGLERGGGVQVDAAALRVAERKIRELSQPVVDEAVLRRLALHEHLPPHELLEGELDLRLIVPREIGGDAAYHVLAKIAPERRGDAQHGVRLRAEIRAALRDQTLERARDLELEGPHHLFVRALDAPGARLVAHHDLFRDRAPKELAHHEGLALRDSVHRIDDGMIGGLDAEQIAHDRRGVTARERLELEHPHARRGARLTVSEPGEHLLLVLAAHRADAQERQRQRRVGEELAQHAEAQRIRPVHVVDGEHRRPLRDEPAQDVEHRGTQAERLVGRALGGGSVQAEHLRDHREQRGERRHGIVRVGVERQLVNRKIRPIFEHALERVERTGVDGLARPIRRGEQLPALRGEEVQALPLRELGGLEQEASLAHAALARHQDEPSGGVVHGLERALHDRERLCLAVKVAAMQVRKARERHPPGARGAQELDHVVGVADALLRALLEQALDELTQVVRHPFGEVMDGRRVTAEVLSDALLARAHERRTPAHELEQHAAERIEIDARVDEITADLFGRHVRRGAGNVRVDLEAIAPRRGKLGCGAEVDEDGRAVFTQEDVVRLHVAVHEPLQVQVTERAADLLGQALDALDVGGIEPSLLAGRGLRPGLDEIRERAAAQELHRVPERAVARGHPGVEERHDARVLEPREDRLFLAKERAIQRRERHLERRLLPGANVASLIEERLRRARDRALELVGTDLTEATLGRHA
jgi:hypothetical protein